VDERYNEVELLILVTPEFVSALDPHEVPPCGPGQLTTSPNDVDLYWRGYLEVPRCCTDGSCANCQGGAMPGGQEVMPGGAVPEPEIPGSVPVEPVSHGRALPLPRPAAGLRVEPTLIGPSGYDDLQ
jgi:pilus assembly protein CpaC